MIILRRILVRSFLPLSFLLAELAPAQTTPVEHYWIYLRQRITTGATPQALEISERAMRRRAKVLPPNELIDKFDDPVPRSAIEEIRAAGAKIRTVSRWLNAVSVEATPGEIRTISASPSVRSTAPVVELTMRTPETAVQPSTPHRPRLQKGAGLDYGQSYAQLNNIGIITLHAMGINGSGVLVGIMDDGFNNHTTHVALKNIHVAAEYDFVQQDSNTSSSPGEDPAEGLHGAGTLSSVAGFDDGALIGGAFGVSVILAKTEIDSVEIHAEEDNYVAALEWMERLGADISSSSLGYRDFDPPDSSYNYSQLDGHTTVVATAASIAARKGLLLVTAMGNEGYQVGSSSFAPGTILSPGDADSVISVGATSLDGVYLASFSGTGPTADGRTKPEVVAPGVNVYWAYGNSSSLFWSVNGTSAATPLTASAAALVLSAHPELTPMQVRQALMNTATPLSDAYPSLEVPNNFYGYGFIDAYKAVLNDGLAFSNIPIITVKDSFYFITTWIASKSTLNADSLAFYYKYPSDASFTRAPLSQGPNLHQYRAIIPQPPTGIVPVGYFAAADGSGPRTSPYDAPANLYSIVPTPDSIRQFYPNPGLPSELTPTTYILKNNFPNPFNSATTILFYAPTGNGVELTVFNILGQRVRTLFRGTPVADWNSVQWVDSRDDYGHAISSGVYFVRLKTPNSVLTQKMVYLK
jgi:serine protease AprX